MKKNAVLLLLSLLSLSTALWAQNDPKDRVLVQGKIKKAETKAGEELPNGWRRGGEGILNLSLTSLNQNWQAQFGGNNNLLAVANLGLFGNYKQNKFTWNNDLRITYGFVNFLDRQSDDPFKVRKADDIIMFGSKAGYELSKKLYAVGFLDFITQFSPGYKYGTDSIGAETRTLVSKGLSPAVLRLGAGIDYRPSDYFSIMFAPVSFRGLIVSDQAIANQFIHGNAAEDGNPLVGKKFTPEFGALLQAKFKKDLGKNINYESNLDLFQNYLNSFDGTYVTWNNLLSLKVNEYITTRIESNLIYNTKADVNLVEAGIQNGLQHRLFFGVGFGYKFGAKP